MASVNFVLSTGPNKVDLLQGLALKDAIGALTTLDEASHRSLSSELLREQSELACAILCRPLQPLRFWRSKIQQSPTTVLW